jgi:1-phosphofructokinase family hexose kinase
VIHSFGGRTLAIAVSGGATGARLEKYVTGCGFPSEIVPIANEIRCNLTITDKRGLTVKLNEIGPYVSAGELDRLEAAVRAHLAEAKWLMICGSIPPGVPPGFYAKLITAAREAGVKTLLDTDGEALVEGLRAAPSVVAPNQQEAERLLNKALLTRTHFLEAASKIRGMGAEAAVVSLGSRGAVGAYQGRSLEAIPPRVDAVCPIGAGDALAAAFVWAMREKGDFAEALRWGVAAGTASARLPGLRFASLEQTRAMHAEVEVRAAG